jgi:hypothetical protein
LAGLLFLLPGTSRAEVICRKERPLKPVHCLCGKLIDPSGAPVSSAAIRVDRDGKQVATGSTNADGKFLFQELKSGRYELAADFDGFVPFRSPVVLTKPTKKCRHKLVIVMVLHYPDNCGSYVMKP